MKYTYEDYEYRMDDELRERLHMDLAPCAPALFLEKYLEMHLEEYGEYFNPFDEREGVCFDGI